MIERHKILIPEILRKPPDEFLRDKKPGDLVDLKESMNWTDRQIIDLIRCETAKVINKLEEA